MAFGWIDLVNLCTIKSISQSTYSHSVDTTNFKIENESFINKNWGTTKYLSFRQSCHLTHWRFVWNEFGEFSSMPEVSWFVLTATLFFFFLSLFIYFERVECECVRCRGRETETEDPKQALRWQSKPSARLRAWTSKLWDHDRSRSLLLNAMSHPIAPNCYS